MGSMRGSGPSSIPRGQRGPFSFRTGRAQCVVRDHTRRPHHVENPRGEAEQQKHDHSPRRNPKPAVEQPADGRTDDHASNELGRKAEATSHRRHTSGRGLALAAFGCTVGMDVAEPFAETLESRGERSLVGWWVFAISFFARVVGHAFDTRNIATVPPPQGRADHTDWVYPSQESASSCRCHESEIKSLAYVRSKCCDWTGSERQRLPRPRGAGDCRSRGGAGGDSFSGNPTIARR